MLNDQCFCVFQVFLDRKAWLEDQNYREAEAAMKEFEEKHVERP